MALVQRRNTALKSKSRSAADDDDNDDEDDEDERPARRRSSAKPEFKEPRRSRSSRDEDDDDLPDEDEDDRPKRRSGGGKSDAVASGWGAAKRLKEEGGDYAAEFKFDSKPTLVKFLSDAPFAVYKQHWVEGLRSTKKRSFICLGKGCPLCAVGESTSKKWAFNVAIIDLDGGDEAEVKALIAGSRLFDDIADEHEQNNGIDNGFYALSKSGKKQSTTYKVKLVKERDLEEDWEITPEEAEDQLEGLELYTAEQFKAPSKSYLQEIADEITDGDD